MIYAKIENNLIVNVIVADANFAAQQGLIELPDHFDGKAIGIGWHYDGVNFTEPVEIVAPVDTAPSREQLLEELRVLTAKIEALA